MSSIEREDDFEQRRKVLASLSDDELTARFWELAEQIVAPLVQEARCYTTPAIERSVLLRMGFSSIESARLVEHMQKRGILGHGAGRQVLELSKIENTGLRQAGEALLQGKYWERLPL